MSLYLGSQTFSPCLWNTPGMFWSCPGKQELFQEPTPKAVGSIPGINLSKWVIICINALLIKCPISLYVYVPLWLSLAMLCRVRSIEGLIQWKVSDSPCWTTSYLTAAPKNPSSSMFSGEVVGVVKVPAQRPLQWCYRFFQSDKSDCWKKGDLWGW